MQIMDNRINYKRLLESGREEKCECCGISEWNGKSIKLQVHHIDGNRKNNDLSNLQLLCPNCHSQTDNFCSKNRKDEKEHCYCKKCGVEITKNTQSGLCRNCWDDVQRERSNKPDKETLIKDCKELKSYSKVSKKYNVSDKTIRKWCMSYDFLISDL